MPQKRDFKAKNLIFAKKMRRNLTKAEFIIWKKIRNQQLGIKFRRQYPIGNFIVDFISLEKKIIIEIDGGGHSESKYDYLRDYFLMDKGFRVLRFYNSDIYNHLDDVMGSIIYASKNKDYTCNYNYQYFDNKNRRGRKFFDSDYSKFIDELRDIDEY
jgi:very-short-patch-repair endonuclease